ncbi:CRISPR/Cas system CSM-associated protein Csm3, group 7 of RAMP superfamily [Ruminococcaceae bacterium P7]|nr:CRISPR/Cas system CSM-associated protein Csm3, group 7 of RAMP superfamily [Ruminococcaceae bacterium P7]
MRKLMKIELKSDLCASVGKHYAANINLDTALDEYGLPYIPSRRLKGCMREVAEMIGITSVNNIFGISGNSESGSLKIGNAVIKDYSDTVDSLRANEIFHSKVTDLFCYTRQETAIDNDTNTAKDGTLRFVRVVKKNYPGSDKPMCFYAPVSFNEKDKDNIEKICKALRNIGYHRNRGLGAVECSLTDDYAEFELEKRKFDDEAEYVMSYLIRLEGDMMVPASDSSYSMDYIPGTSVLGALAAKYNGENFDSLFLSDNVKFGNLYISDSKATPFYPAPRFLAKIKAAKKDKDKGIKNTIGKELESCDDSKPITQYKNLKKGYINKDCGHREPERKIVYHNNIKDIDGGLYMQYCICRGQYFRGTITAKGKYLKDLYPLFSDGELYLGRSKTAQYAACRIIENKDVKIKIEQDNTKCFTAKRDSVVAFVLQSDVILTNESGVFTAEAEALLNNLKEALHTDNLIFDEKDSLITDKTVIAVKVISGYNAKWNLKKPQITAFAAGSAIIARVKDDTELPEKLYIGEKQNEGFGVISVIENADSYAVNETKTSNGEKTQCDILALVEERNRRDELLELAVKKAQDIFCSSEKLLNSSQIGRILLMCKEACDEDNFDKRLESITNDSFRRIAQRHFCKEAVGKEVGNEEEWKQIRQYLIDCLYVSKYLMKGKEKK